LLHILRDSNVMGKVGVWIGKFLDSSCRQQAVAVEGRLSALSPVISGVPQGTVLGPILFLLHISGIAKEVSQQSTVSSYVDDTRVTRSITNPAQDCLAMQQDLQAIYRWAEEVNMVFNGDKFEMLRFWPGRSQKPDHLYSDQDGAPIEEKKHLRDLGVQVSSDLTFNIHIENVVSAATKMVGWVMRTFRRRSKSTMLTLWKAMIQSKIDYCSQLWSPNDQASISKLEGVARTFTSRIANMDGLDYWERLGKLGMYSQERRRERYQIIFIWKLSQALVTGYSLPFQHSDRRGLIVTVPPMATHSPPAVRKAREASLQVKGARLFNLVPKEIRNLSGVTVDTFKSGLDAWLNQIPDQPTIPGRQRSALTNSLIDQVVANHSNF
jgi:ribonuclease P/MRP protein subunit RPP40